VKLWIIQHQPVVKKFVIAAALIIVQAASGIAQTREATVHEQSVAESDSATEASKQAANPLASVWLMQFQQNNTWIGMPANGGNRIQSNLQFQPRCQSNSLTTGAWSHARCYSCSIPRRSRTRADSLIA